MGDDSWDTSEFLKRYASKPNNNNNGHANHIQDEEMNSSVEDIFTPYNEEIVFCTAQNLEERLVYLNQELSTLGFPPILEKNLNTKYGKDLNGNFDVTKLVNCTYDLLRTHSRQVRIKDDLEAGQTRINNDNDMLLLTQDKLKHEIETLKNENALSQYREKELTKKCTCLQQDVKSEREEKRKMKSDIDQVRKQFYHESKRLEKEISRLKDKLNQTLGDKSNQTQKVLIDILNPLPRSDGKRSKWNVGTKKIREEEMYKLLIANYEEKEQVLVSENRGMRDTLNEIHKSLFQMDPSTSTLEEFDEEGKQYQMPFHLVREDVNNKLQHLLAFLQKKVEDVNEKSKPAIPTPEVPAEVNEAPDESYKELLSKLDQYKSIISSQEKVIEGMKEGYNEEAFEKLLKTFGTRDEDIIEYEERKKLFQEDLKKYEQDRKDFASYVAQIAKEKEEFDKERVEFYMHRISTPVVNREMKVSPHKGPYKSPSKTPSTPTFVSAPCRNSSKKQKTPSTGELYKYLSLSYDNTSPKKSSGYPVDGSYHEQNSPIRRNSSRKVREHSDKIRKAVEDRQNKTTLGEEKRNILSELENVK